MRNVLKTSWLIGLVCIMSWQSYAVAKPLNVVVTTGMIGDLVSNVGQEHVKMTALMGVGVDPHLYKATHGDLRRLQQADMIFYNGLHLEGKMQDVFEKLARKKPVYAVTQDIDEHRLHRFGKAHDPHVWFDVALWHAAGQLVLEKLIQHDPQNEASYRQNAAQYLKQLSELNHWVKQQISQIPKQQRVLITAHDAFGYFGTAYDMEVRGLQGISTATEFGLHDIKALKELILTRKIKAVFVESSVPKRFLKSLVAGVNEVGQPLKIGGELYSDAMGLSGTPEGTYIGMVKHNVTVIVQALK
ncbi:MAG: zinc ABC transporter substrate-binding protein [Hydrogenovibrio crunogenus]|uniref:ATP-binding cassette (ABC) superfamily transporter, solute-binding component n=1 Tax=Hydrogenovibrio crunogenus (strain DSM 25203 / XCL-2) TaxID=317025 RepID=Q31DN6_HYDCU|nr:zinc ABC transporter substrate-binding protein [Hydrogenovibrio crunogenus]